MRVHVLYYYFTHRLIGIFTSRDKAKEAAEEYMSFLSEKQDAGPREKWTVEDYEYEVLYANEDKTIVLCVDEWAVDRYLKRQGDEFKWVIDA